MKSVIALLLLVLFGWSDQASAQIGSYELTKLNVTHGRGALSSGLDAMVKFQSGSRSLTLQANDNRLTAAHQWDLGQVSVAGTGGIFNNTPWLGARASFDVTSWLSTTHWVGELAGEPGQTEVDPQFFFSYQAVSLTSGDLEMGAAWIHFRRDLPKVTPWVSYSPRISGSCKLVPTVTWDMRTEELLYQVGITWEPKKK